jgi:hypothetical protein
MSQKAVEILIGKVLTDDAFRRGFRWNREATFQMMDVLGLHLTPIERDALSALDLHICDQFAQQIDARIQKASTNERGFSILQETLK